MHFGSFPRKELLDYPLFLLTDSIGYYRPNIEGSSIIYSWRWGRVHGWVDWTGRASEETRESILAGIDLSLTAGWFYFSSTTTRYHLARSKAADDTNRIRDDGSILVLGGIDLSEQIPLDQADLAAGVAISYERTMPSPSQWYRGWISRLKLKYSILGLLGTWYMGDRSPLRYGEPLYTSGNYARIDLMAEPLRNSRISSRFAWNFHLLPGEGLFHSQQIVICIHL
jgi:hypothetical protein